jgi:uncharacterized protein YjbI with pentapeptide repeats
VKRFGWRSGLVFGLAVGLGVGGTVAWAAIPDSATGTITACYPTTGTNAGALRVIDYENGDRCAAGEAMLTWGSAGNCDAFPHPRVNWAKPGAAPGAGCDLSYSDLSDQNLSDALAMNANLRHANLTRAHVNRANFTGANMTDTVWCGIHSFDTDVTNATLTNADMGVCGPIALTRMKGLTSDQLRSIHARFNNLGRLCGGTNVNPFLGSAKFSNVSLAGFDLTDFWLVGAHLSGENLDSANLTRAWAVGLDLSNATLTHATLTCADLSGANFADANLTGANDATSANLANARWSDTTCPDGTNSDQDGNTCVGHL